VTIQIGYCCSHIGPSHADRWQCEGIRDQERANRLVDDETINIFAVAIRNGSTAPQLSDTVFAYLTSGSDVS
jgi:hypothetical protein